MIFFNHLAMFGLVGSALALPRPQGPMFPTDAGCGEVTVFYTGFPAYHPYVTAQGFDPTEVDRVLKKGAAYLVKAGYNLRTLFQGPDQPVTNIADRMEGTRWDVDALGFGVRGFANATATTRFEDNLYQYRESAPLTPTVFNWSPESFAEAVIRRVPLKDDCTNNPGKLIAYEEVCDPSVCKKITVILDGDLDKLH